MNNNWQHRIKQHTELPPEELWNRVVLELERQTQQELSERLQQHEELPPEEIWGQIVQSLDSEKEIQAPPVFTPHLQSSNLRHFSWLKMGIAAGILLLLGSTLYWYVIQQSASVTSGNAVASTPSKTKYQSADSSQKIVPLTIPQHSTNAKGAIVQNNKQVNKKIDSTLLQIITIPVGSPIHATPTIDLAVEGLLNFTDIASNRFPEEISQPYFTITGPDGGTVRVSSKLKNIAPLLSERDPANEENIDLIIKNSAGWKLKLKDWKDRMLQIPFTPSPTQPMSIIELGKMLDEKEK